MTSDRRRAKAGRKAEPDSDEGLWKLFQERSEDEIESHIAGLKRELASHRSSDGIQARTRVDVENDLAWFTAYDGRPIVAAQWLAARSMARASGHPELDLIKGDD